MKLKVLAKEMARNNGGDLDKARQEYQQRRIEAKIHSFEYIFLKKYKEVNENVNG